MSTIFAFDDGNLSKVMRPMFASSKGFEVLNCIIKSVMINVMQFKFSRVGVSGMQPPNYMSPEHVAALVGPRIVRTIHTETAVTVNVSILPVRRMPDEVTASKFSSFVSHATPI